jgi:hypothetical protein
VRESGQECGGVSSWKVPPSHLLAVMGRGVERTLSSTIPSASLLPRELNCIRTEPQALIRAGQLGRKIDHPNYCSQNRRRRGWGSRWGCSSRRGVRPAGPPFPVPTPLRWEREAWAPFSVSLMDFDHLFASLMDMGGLAGGGLLLPGAGRISG